MAAVVAPVYRHVVAEVLDEEGFFDVLEGAPEFAAAANMHLKQAGVYWMTMGGGAAVGSFFGPVGALAGGVTGWVAGTLIGQVSGVPDKTLAQLIHELNKEQRSTLFKQVQDKLGRILTRPLLIAKSDRVVQLAEKFIRDNYKQWQQPRGGGRR